VRLLFLHFSEAHLHIQFFKQLREFKWGSASGHVHHTLVPFREEHVKSPLGGTHTECRRHSQLASLPGAQRQVLSSLVRCRRATGNFRTT